MKLYLFTFLRFYKLLSGKREGSRSARSVLNEKDIEYLPNSSPHSTQWETDPTRKSFNMNIKTIIRIYRLMRRDPTDWHIIVPETFSASINPANNANHLEVVRNGEDITLTINGSELGTWSDGNIQGPTFMGLVSSPYGATPTSVARFDNYSVEYLPPGAPGFEGINSITGSSEELKPYEASPVRPSIFADVMPDLMFSKLE